MTDRDLLEAAARAAGISIDDWNGDCPVRYVTRWSGDPNEEPQQDYAYWNPLRSDGDALRLAVRLSLIIDTHGMFTRAATRRAIVRAAAQIGGERC